MANLIISGEKNPEIGQETFYSIFPVGLSTSVNNPLSPIPSQMAQWEIYVLENGRWRKTTGNAKTGDTVSYNFKQGSLIKKGIKIIVNKGNDKGELVIKPKRAGKPKINSVELLDVNYHKVIKPLNYLDTLIARVHCTDMENEKVYFTLWEDDAIGKGHDKINEMNRINPVPLFNTVMNGKAVVKFNMAFYTQASRIADMQLAKGDKSEGKNHEYYVTVDYYGKIESSNNINIKNPTSDNPIQRAYDHKYPKKGPEKPTVNKRPSPSSPKPKKDTYKVPITEKAKTKAVDSQGKILSVEFVNFVQQPIKDLQLGAPFYAKIRSKGLKGKTVKLKIWEDDAISDDLLHEENVTLISDVCLVKLNLTEKMHEKGGDIFGQQYFLEIEHAAQSIESEVINVNDDVTKIKVESGNSVKMVKKVEKVEREKEEKVSECYCNRDLTSDEFKNIFKKLRDGEKSVKLSSGYKLFDASNCKLKLEEKSLEKLRTEINKTFNKYDINSCIRKIHFLAQIYHETDRFRTTREYDTQKIYKPYFGRGLMQLTHDSNYKIYKSYSGINCYADYEIIEKNLYYACDSAGWFWKQGKVLSVGERWKGPSDAPSYVKIHKPNYPKTTITWKDSKEKKEYGTVDFGLIADDDKVDLISYLVNGGSNGIEERRNYVLTLKSVFEYYSKCRNIKRTKNTVITNDSNSITIRLIRKWQTNKSTIGDFTIDNTKIKGYIIEEKGPDTTTSGIEQRVPIGTYNLEWHSGTKIKKGLKLYNDVVSKSRAILIHSGNTANDTEGCLLPGSTKSTDYVGGSRDKLKEIFDYVEEIGIKDAKIIITQAYE